MTVYEIDTALVCIMLLISVYTLRMAPTTPAPTAGSGERREGGKCVAAARALVAAARAYVAMLWSVGACDHPGCSRIIWSFQRHWYGHFVAQSACARVQLCPEHASSLLRDPIALRGGSRSSSTPLVSGWYVAGTAAHPRPSDTALCMPADVFAMRLGLCLPCNPTLSDWYSAHLSNGVRRPCSGTHGYRGWWNCGLLLCMVLATTAVVVWGTGSAGSDVATLIAVLALPPLSRLRLLATRQLMARVAGMGHFNAFVASNRVIEAHWKVALGHELTPSEAALHRWMIPSAATSPHDRGCGCKCLNFLRHAALCTMYDRRMFGTTALPKQDNVTAAPSAMELHWTHDLSQYDLHHVSAELAVTQHVAALVRAAEQIPSNSSVAV